MEKYCQMTIKNIKIRYGELIIEYTFTLSRLKKINVFDNNLIVKKTVEMFMKSEQIFNSMEELTVKVVNVFGPFDEVYIVFFRNNI